MASQDPEMTLRAFDKAERTLVVHAFEEATLVAHEIAPDGWSIRTFADRGDRSPQLRLFMRGRVAMSLENDGGTGRLWLALDKATLDADPTVADKLASTPNWEQGGLQYAAFRPSVCGFLYLGDGGTAILAAAWPALRAFIERESHDAHAAEGHDWSAVAALRRHGAARLPDPPRAVLGGRR